MFNNDKHNNELRSNFKHFRQQGAAQPKTNKTEDITETKFNFADVLQLNEAVQDTLLHASRTSTEIEVVKDYIRSSYDTIRTNSLTKKIELSLMGETKELNDRVANGWLDHLWSNATYTSVDGRSGKETVKKVTMDKNKLYTIIDNDSFSPEYDPILDYFEGVAPLAENISSTPEIDKFFKCFTCNNDDTTVEQYFKSWFAGVFINYFSKYDKYDSILIMQSDQGVGKTTAIEHHLLKPFRDYVVKNFSWNINNKDEIVKLATSLFIFDDELSATKKSEIAELKKITSLTIINGVRPVYARTTVNYKRKASFIGATNSMNIISDETGDRRFLILEVLSIDWTAIANINYDLLWSEAYNYFHVQGNKVKLDSNLVKANNQKFRFMSAEEQYLDRHFDFDKPENEWMTTTEVMDYLKEKEPNLHTDIYKIGKVLRSKGLKSVSKRINGSAVYRYPMHKISSGSQQLFVTKASGNNEASTCLEIGDFIFGENSVSA